MDNVSVEISLRYDSDEDDYYEHYGYYETIDEAIKELLRIKQNIEND